VTGNPQHLSIFRRLLRRLLLTTVDGEARVRADRARRIALWRYQLIREPADPAYSTRQRGRMVRQLAEREHPGPFGTPVRVARATLDRWITAWRRGGFDALVPSPRQATPRTPAEILDMAAALKRENPGRTAAQVARILHKHLGWAPSESTVLRHLNRLELVGPTPQTVEFGRFEADHPNELWVGDALCRARHKASYADRRVMPTGQRSRCRAAVSVWTGSA
jgi:putative transposase